MNIVVVGAGFFGAVIAERIVTEVGLPVTIVEQRGHVGGNCWSELCPDTGIEIHRYGSHIFHTSNERVWAYIRRFAEFNSYKHRVLTTAGGRVYPMPINRTTINRFYGLNLAEEDVFSFVSSEAAKEDISVPRNLEEKGISLVGRKLYDAFIKGYTIKQWEKNPVELSPSIITRLPVRNDDNDLYFSDAHEGIPVDGYAEVFERMLNRPLISVRLNTDFFSIQHELSQDTLVIYTGPIDRFFNYRYGRLEWRTIDFEKTIHDVPDVLGVAVMNYADVDIPYTRIHEYKHYHPERLETGNSVTFKEFSRTTGAGDQPYYPVNTERNRRLYCQYEQETACFPNVIFGGRLGTYRYVDMDQTIGMALVCYQEQILPRLRGQDE
jgi:UDP-galactopyranose mutase